MCRQGMHNVTCKHGRRDLSINNALLALVTPKTYDRTGNLGRQMTLEAPSVVSKQDGQGAKKLLLRCRWLADFTSLTCITSKSTDQVRWALS
eukprot:5949062-Amphidinium_carterae.1